MIPEITYLYLQVSPKRLPSAEKRKPATRQVMEST